MRQVGLDPARRVDKVQRVVVVLLHARGHGQDVRIEDDVLWREANFIDKDFVSALADANLVFEAGRLSLLVEGHHNCRRAILQHCGCVRAELCLTFLQRDGVHNPLALHALQTRLDHFPLRRVHHKRHLRHFRLARQQVQVARHRRHAVDHALVHADIEYVGAVLHLLSGHGNGFFVFVGLDQFGKLRRTGHVGSLAHQDKDAELLHEGLRTGKPQRLEFVLPAHALTPLASSSARCAIQSRGALPSRALAMAAMCSGVLPQQPPAILMSPPSANSPR